MNNDHIQYVSTDMDEIDAEITKLMERNRRLVKAGDKLGNHIACGCGWTVRAVRAETQSTNGTKLKNTTNEH